MAGGVLGEDNKLLLHHLRGLRKLEGFRAFQSLHNPHSIFSQRKLLLLVSDRTCLLPVADLIT